MLSVMTVKLDWSCWSWWWRCRKTPPPHSCCHHWFDQLNTCYTHDQWAFALQKSYIRPYVGRTTDKMFLYEIIASLQSPAFFAHLDNVAWPKSKELMLAVEGHNQSTRKNPLVAPGQREEHPWPEHLQCNLTLQDTRDIYLYTFLVSL